MVCIQRVCGGILKVAQYLKKDNYILTQHAGQVHVTYGVLFIYDLVTDFIKVSRFVCHPHNSSSCVQSLVSYAYHLISYS